MKNKKNRANDKKVRQASNFWGNFRRQPRKLAVLLAVIIIAGIGAHLTFNSRAATFASGAETENGTVGGNSTVQNDSNASGGKFVKFGGTSSVFSAMGIPSYTGSTWSATSKTFDDRFASLNNWNYGVTGQGGNCSPWFGSGTAPNQGSGGNPQNMFSYFLPGNVSQTSTGANSSLFTGYTPQSFDSNGWGTTFTAHYTGNKTFAGGTYSWSSGSLNSCGKEMFPSSGDTQVFVQIKAQMMGYQGNDNGAWNALWFLGKGTQQEIDLQETGLNQANAQLPDWVNSTLHNSAGSAQHTIVNDNTGKDLSAGYHIYGVELNTTIGVINIYLDNTLLGSVNAGSIGFGSLTGQWFLILEGTIGSGRYALAPTYNVDMKMNIMQVQVYQR